MNTAITKENCLMPGEWEKHSATWLAWPNDDDYFGDKIKNIEKIYLQIIFHLHKDEPVKLLVLNKEKEEKVKVMMQEFGIDLSKIIFFHVEYFDVWMRDYGPTFVKKENKKAWVKWNYDGYGMKFPELLPDNKVFLTLKDPINLEMIEAGIALEGGAIESNGNGVLMTTEECLLLNRNIGKNKEENELIFKKLLGIEKVIWLKRGLVNDHTDGHIDEIARFVSPLKILCGYEENKEDENYERLNENYKILENSTDQNGNKFEIIKLPMPHMEYKKCEKEFCGKKAPVSYANFYIGNSTVLVSIFDDENDKKAIEIIKSCFPNREVIGIDCRDLIYGGGAIHCITQQEPEL
ncbi:MAG TPA: agmatine deiminase family protein [Candidatus Paceibacterota bacterium]|nr:agmatine deiminase family protein [Candidatus Paceibacterota bacterium]HPT18148.1 agmatine deiminase family protein [Candidatus Paceibacterota bacterium]